MRSSDNSCGCGKRIETALGWIRGSTGLARVKLREPAKLDAAFPFALDTLNLPKHPGVAA